MSIPPENVITYLIHVIGMYNLMDKDGIIRYFNQGGMHCNKRVIIINYLCYKK